MLPATIQRIVALVGHAKAMALVDELGGQDQNCRITRRLSNIPADRTAPSLVTEQSSKFDQYLNK